VLRSWHNRCVVKNHVMTPLLAASDSGSSRVVYAMVLGLVLIGVVFVFIGVWLIRSTRVDPELLAPLERMSESKWRKKDLDTRRSMLNEVRPAGARVPNWQDPQDPPVAVDLPTPPPPPDPPPPDPPPTTNA
jgi:hypothetical protein